MLTWIIIGGGLVLIVLLSIGLVVSISSERTVLDQRLGQYLGEERPADEGGRRDQSSAITDWVSRRVERTSYGDKIARQLARADVKLKVAEYIALIVISVFGVGAIAWLLGSRSPISFLIGAAFGLGFILGNDARFHLAASGDGLAAGLRIAREEVDGQVGR